MCGIAGFFDTHARISQRAMDENVRAMTDAIDYRGPDAAGAWSDVSAGIALGHRRLSIVDLSTTGSQPMPSQCGRYVLSYNGEVYNAPHIVGSSGCI
jgi:asparagine synthase (glutamine-hydrolysing)